MTPSMSHLGVNPRTGLESDRKAMEWISQTLADRLYIRFFRGPNFGKAAMAIRFARSARDVALFDRCEPVSSEKGAIAPAAALDVDTYRVVTRDRQNQVLSGMADIERNIRFIETGLAVRVGLENKRGGIAFHIFGEHRPRQTPGSEKLIADPQRAALRVAAFLRSTQERKPALPVLLEIGNICRPEMDASSI